MLNETTCSTSSKCCKCVSWSSIFVGALVALGLGFLVYLLTAGLGLTAFTTDPTGLTTLAIGAFIVLFILSYIIMFLSGWTSGLLLKAYTHKGCWGGLHGFAAWCLALVIAIATHSLFMASGAATLPANTTAAFTQYKSDVGKTDDVTVSKTTLSKKTESGKVTASKVTLNKTAPADTTVTATAPAEKAANTLGIGVLATFFLFLIGAIGSWMGGYFGVQSRCGEDREHGSCKVDTNHH